MSKTIKKSKMIMTGKTTNDDLKIERGEIVKKVLAGIGLAGIAVAMIAAPNIFQAFPRSYRRTYSRKSLDQTVRRLLKKGWIKFVKGSHGWRLELTEAGLREFQFYEHKEKLIERPKKWNGKWHMLVFDIEEKRKIIREQVRRTLMELGFHRLQDSVWVHPYECEDVLELLRTKFGVRHEALYICAQKIAKDEWLKRHFGIDT